ncbi:uncharacterized protein TNCV_1852391 [Trichonephila clavipes]|nr:uncharacterized protein TNCV_1852391 [Trichonephila clavipes]
MCLGGLSRLVVMGRVLMPLYVDFSVSVFTLRGKNRLRIFTLRLTGGAHRYHCSRRKQKPTSDVNKTLTGGAQRTSLNQSPGDQSRGFSTADSLWLGTRACAVLAISLRCQSMFRICWYLRRGDFLSSDQYGFTPHKSTEDALLRLNEIVKRDKKKHLYSILISLDIKGAFDNARWPCIPNLFKKAKIPINIFSLVTEFLNDRVAKMQLGSTSAIRCLERGCPKGSVSGPIFWNIIINDLLSKPNNLACCEIIAFADDILVCSQGRDLSATFLHAQEALNLASDWSKSFKLDLNSDKTRFRTTEKRNVCYDAFQLYLDGTLSTMGNTNFLDLKTVGGQELETFRQACEKLGMLKDENHWDAKIEEDVLCRSPSQIRELFSILICTCGLSNPLQLWDKYKTALSEDILHRFERMDQVNNDLCLNEALRLKEDKIIKIS